MFKVGFPAEAPGRAIAASPRPDNYRDCGLSALSLTQIQKLYKTLHKQPFPNINYLIFNQ